MRGSWRTESLLLDKSELRSLPRNGVLDPLKPGNLWSPGSEFSGFAVVSDEVLLIVGTPREILVVQRYAEAVFEVKQKFQQRHAVLDSAADVEGLAAGALDVFVCSNVTGDRVRY